MTGALDLQSLAQFSVERILNCALEGMVIALLAWLILRAIGPRNSGTRFAVWFAALLGIAALPLFGAWAVSGSGLEKRSEIILPAAWALYIFAAWLLVASLGLLRLAVGFWHLRRLRQSAAPVDFATLDPVLRNTLAEFESHRTVELAVSDNLRVPTAIGFVRPMVVIPSWTMRELSMPELNAILLHELAHMRRRDDWSNLIQKILGALLFFHPAVWWIDKKLSLEREMACDDMVLARTETADPRAYAECLVSLAEKSLLRRGLALAQAAVDRLRQVSLRVTRILDVNRPQATRVWSPAPLLVGAISILCLMVLSHAPAKLVSFENAADSLSAINTIPPGDFETGSRMSEAGARVVPAKLATQIRPQAHNSFRKTAKPVGKSLIEAANQPSITPARPAMVPENPMLVRASVKGDVNPQALFFVMRTEVVQTRQYDASGAVVWDLCVWQVTVVGPVQNKTEAGMVAKSI
jgi:beta-lactamase regulating signal transducer with metallopeptidase domain